MHGTKQECALAIVAEPIRVKNFACSGECCVYVHAGLVVVVSRVCVRAIARRSLQRRASNSQWLAPGLGLGACWGCCMLGLHWLCFACRSSGTRGEGMEA